MFKVVGLRNFVAIGVLGILILSGPLRAAPLFPDVPENHWARDAVAALAAKGLVEGYPDGTFKGDRASSRWEVAMVVARLLAKMEQAHATFATKAELEELRKLSSALRDELEALGVRVTNLEESTDRLEKRVTELERITFYGNFEARVSFHSLTNQGANLSDTTDALVNFDSAVGSVAGTGGRFPAGPAAGFNFDPFAVGTFTVNNLKTGRPLTSGTGFTSLLTLGLNTRITPDLDAGAEFTAFTSQGDQAVGLYYGVSAPYLSNAFTAISTVTGGLAGTQPQNNRPFTRMTLDNFWVHHKPSDTRLRVGTIDEPHFNTQIYQKQYNPGAFGPAFLDSYGVQVHGHFPLDEDESQELEWEVMGTLLPDRNGGVGGAAYFNHAEGLNLAYHFHDDQGEVRLNFLHAANDASGGAARQVGLIAGTNIGPVPWVNPPGFFFNQLGGPNQATAGIGSTSDVRPVPMSAVNNDGITGVLGEQSYGNIGPQDQVSYGISANYEWDIEVAPRIGIDYGHSDYRPQKNSAYTVDGDAFRVTAGVTPLEGLDIDLSYVSVDPTYDPFVIQIPRLGGVLRNGIRLGENFLSYRGDLYSLHDTDIYPHNREGFRADLLWEFNANGAVNLKLGFLDQKDPSLQDVRFSANSLGAGTPNTPVLGFSPGFVDPVFGGFSPFTFVASGNALATPLESPSGSSDFFSLTAEHKWYFDEEETRGVRLTGHLNNTNFRRDSNLAQLRPGPLGIRGENVNYVDLDYTGWEIGVGYDATQDFTLNLGYGLYSIRGHYDPFGVYSAFAESTGTTRFDNLDVEQTQPFVGFDYQIDPTMTWSLEAIFMSTRDQVSSAVFSTPNFPSVNAQFTPQRSVHPFSYDGILINSSFNVSF